MTSSSRRKQAKFWSRVGMLLTKTIALRTPIVVLCWKRTEEEQKILVNRGASKTMNSMHLIGLAIDIAFLEDIEDDGVINWKPDKYKELGEYWESLGGRWGGRFGDDPTTEKIEGWDAGHFEYKEK